MLAHSGEQVFPLCFLSANLTPAAGSAYLNTDICTVGIVNLLEAFPLPTIEAYICAEETQNKYVASACKPLAISETCFTKHPVRTAGFKAF